ncbi:DNA mismatch repair protein Mlh1 [Anastrepha ludens]|uniref:DNA mismatch repair protein Mlh1 n=1 Tax=Anastrepha ludens TaxID=28586 RepID=UPI0023B1540B|nr:DNA mismatch repair protein Mlh1 [Anastrepha ludens]XP_053963536.1 DNA mismatch repair protein Mlh1 [Anastrepha ludens]
MEPGIIKKLDEVVVNRIAAGEIIQKPANALKELIENSLDAKATHVQVTVKSGGLKLLQIQDNGTGIRREDLSILCERFTTSKLKKFEDLSNIGTFGFRGEALASISHVAHLSIQTKTANESCGYKALYENGQLKGPPKACAGNQGTIITVEDIFYNMPQRRQCLKSPAEEMQIICEVVSKYAVHNSNVAFTLKKYGEPPSLRTVGHSSCKENICNIYGSQIGRVLLPIELEDDIHKFKMTALVTKVDYSAKRGIMLLFINHRLVESTALKTAIDGVYSTYLPKGMHPFIYISLEMASTQLDVNVHPTKHAVHFLYEDEIIDKIKRRIELKLLGSNASRTFYKQLRLSGIPNTDSEYDDKGAKIKHNDKERIDKDRVRTDSKEQKLEKFLLKQGASGQVVKTNSTTLGNMTEESFSLLIPRSKVQLTSIKNMQENIERRLNVTLRKTLKDLVFVGVVDKAYALFQQETKLYLCNTLKFCEELFYQRLIFEFQRLAHIKFEPSLSIKNLVEIALDSEEAGWSPEDGDKLELAERASNILLEKAPMLREYFSLHISKEGQLETLPAILPQHYPCSTHLPLYILRLATEVDWDSEVECFETFCRETSQYYALISTLELSSQPQRHKWLVEHVLYPGLKRYLLPPNSLKQHLYELSSLSRLYKVFERC